jgi:hypothetical protein
MWECLSEPTAVSRVPAPSPPAQDLFDPPPALLGHESTVIGTGLFDQSIPLNSDSTDIEYVPWLEETWLLVGVSAVFLFGKCLPLEWLRGGVSSSEAIVGPSLLSLRVLPVQG